MNGFQLQEVRAYMSANATAVIYINVLHSRHMYAMHYGGRAGETSRTTDEERDACLCVCAFMYVRESTLICMCVLCCICLDFVGRSPHSLS